MVLITGVSGLLGSFVLKKFVKKNIPVIALKRPSSNISALTEIQNNVLWVEDDINDLSSLQKYAKEIECVIHCAGLVSFDPRDKKKLFTTNVKGTQNVVNFCLTQGVSQLIHVSSVAALGKEKKNTLDESAIWIDSPTNSLYAQSKYLAELEVYRGIEEGLNASIVCPSVILAPSDWRKSSSQLFYYVWKEYKFFPKGLTNYVDVDDVAEIIFRMYTQKIHNERIIANAGSISYQELFGHIATRLKKKKPSIQIHPSFEALLTWMEEIRSWLTGQKPLITREVLKSRNQTITYSNKKSIELLKIHYKTLFQTLDQYSAYYLRTYSIKK